VTGLKRSTGAPEIPTIAEAGVPGYQIDSWYGVIVPARTPAPIIARLHKEITAIVRSPEVSERLAREGAEPVTSTPQEFAAHIRAERRKWATLIQRTGVKVN
jgi:tripartite-type tricarboxylate transporter receptor subunit TctC